MVKTKEELCLAPTLSTIAGLRRAVCIDPHDDTVRFALADSLEEPGSSEQERKWAALIRFQIALTTYGDGSDPAVARLIAGTNEPALLRDLTPWLRRGERCERCKGKGMLRKRATRLGGEEHRCPTCHGIGWLGSLAESRTDESVIKRTGRLPSDWTIPATFARGLVARVELTAAQVQDAAFMSRLFSEWPIVEAGLVGAVPNEDGGYTLGPNYMKETFDWWHYVATDGLGYSDGLPTELFDEVAKHGWRYDYDDGDSVCEFPTAEAANAALSAAIVSLGRAAAGLPQIGET